MPYRVATPCELINSAPLAFPRSVLCLSTQLTPTCTSMTRLALACALLLALYAAPAFARCEMLRAYHCQWPAADLRAEPEARLVY